MHSIAAVRRFLTFSSACISIFKRFRIPVLNNSSLFILSTIFNLLNPSTFDLLENKVGPAYWGLPPHDAAYLRSSYVPEVVLDGWNRRCSANLFHGVPLLFMCKCLWMFHMMFERKTKNHTDGDTRWFQYHNISLLCAIECFSKKEKGREREWEEFLLIFIVEALFISFLPYSSPSHYHHLFSILIRIHWNYAFLIDSPSSSQAGSLFLNLFLFIATDAVNVDLWTVSGVVNCYIRILRIFISCSIINWCINPILSKWNCKLQDVKPWTGSLPSISYSCTGCSVNRCTKCYCTKKTQNAWLQYLDAKTKRH